MGRGSRMRPARLPEKILQIREALGETQEEMARRLGFQGITREYISGFERGTREPPLPVLLKLAYIAGVHVEVLIDDDLNMPASLPSNLTSIGSKVGSGSRKGTTRK